MSQADEPEEGDSLPPEPVQNLGPEVIHSPRTPDRALVTLFRKAEDQDGKCGEWGPWEPFCLSGEGELPGIDEPERVGGPKIGRWWQQQSRAWFERVGSTVVYARFCPACGEPAHIVPKKGCLACESGIPGDFCCPSCQTNPRKEPDVSP